MESLLKTCIIEISFLKSSIFRSMLVFLAELTTVRRSCPSGSNLLFTALFINETEKHYFVKFGISKGSIWWEKRIINNCLHSLPRGVKVWVRSTKFKNFTILKFWRRTKFFLTAKNGTKLRKYSFHLGSRRRELVHHSSKMQ